MKNIAIPAGGIYYESMKQYGRKVLLEGRSMVNVITTAAELGYLSIPENTLIEPEEMKKFIADSHNISVVRKEEVASENDELGFNEFADWSKETDLLILVDEGLLLCLPDPDTRNVIFDAA